MKPKVNEQTRDKYFEKEGLIRFGELEVGVFVKDVRFRYGHVDVLVSPVYGSGSQWVEATRLNLV